MKIRNNRNNRFRVAPQHCFGVPQADESADFALRLFPVMPQTEVRVSAEIIKTMV